jgi:hypothetical protein
VRILCFDIDGTILRQDTATAKPALARGHFERLVFSGGFKRVICVGRIVTVIRELSTLDRRADGVEIVFRYCDGAFTDLETFRASVDLVEDSEHRARCIDYGADWWYVDDQAPFHLRLDSMESVLEAELGRRICTPRPNGDGSGVVSWLKGLSG